MDTVEEFKMIQFKFKWIFYVSVKLRWYNNIWIYLFKYKLVSSDIVYEKGGQIIFVFGVEKLGCINRKYIEMY